MVRYHSLLCMPKDKPVIRVCFGGYLLIFFDFSTDVKVGEELGFVKLRDFHEKIHQGLVKESVSM